MTSLSFTLGAPTRTLNEIKRMHHRVYARHRLALASEVAALTVGHRPVAPFARAHIRVERHSAGIADTDGLYGGLKPLLDVLQPFSARCPDGLGVITDDAPGCLTVEVKQIVCDRQHGKTVVTITEVEP